MMKPRSNRIVGEQPVLGRVKLEASANGALAQRNQVSLNNQQTSAQAIRKRRSSINVYDQPSSLNSRLRQLETDMLRLDEDRTKLFDDTHSALAQYELRLSEIHAILKSRQDNVEKYVEDMKLLLQAKEEFEKQARLLNEKHDRMHEKFMHRETIISREIKLLKNKFELLEKNRQFKSILQKSNSSSENNQDPSAYLDLSDIKDAPSESGSYQQATGRSSTVNQTQQAKGTTGSIRRKLPRFHAIGSLLGSLCTKNIKIRKNRVISSDSTRVDQPQKYTDNESARQVQLPTARRTSGGEQIEESTDVAKSETKRGGLLANLFKHWRF